MIPAFDVLQNRKARSRIRLPNDRTRDTAEVADVIEAAAYGRDMAILVAQHTATEASKIHAAELRKTESRVLHAIVTAITNYDNIIRERVWYRRLWRRMQRTPSPQLRIPKADQP